MRVYLTGVFAWSAGGKLLWPDAWSTQLLSMGFFVPDWIQIMKYAFPALELGLAVWIMLPRLQVAALTISIFLSLTFLALHLLSSMLGDTASCGCLGVGIAGGSATGNVVMIAVSAGMLVASVALLFFPRASGEKPASSSGLQPARQP